MWVDGLAAWDTIFGADVDADGAIERMCDQAFLRDPQSFADVQPLHLVIQSCTCSEARSILDDFITTHIAQPLAKAFGQKDIGRAMLAVSVLCGFVTLRVVVASRALQEVERGEMKAMLARAIRTVMTQAGGAGEDVN